MTPSKRESMGPSSFRDSMMLGSSNRDSMMSINGYKRMSLSGGGTTKVLGDLQTAASNAKNALDNTRQQLRLSQRSVGQVRGFLDMSICPLNPRRSSLDKWKT